MRIALDAMGSDTHPEPELTAVVQASKQWNDPILLVGPQDLLKSFKSVKRIKEASMENLAETVGLAKAKKIYETFH